jgi:RNA polymerase sigma-70 factor (ECF subfamily)
LVPALAPSDDELMPRAQAGDVDAFAGLYDRHAPGVLALLGRMLSNASEAEDVLHDVFLEAWQAVREFDRTRSSVRTWLLVRARSRALDRIKRRAREPRPYEGLAPIGAILPALVGCSDVEQRLAVQRALAELEPSVREALELSYYEGMTGGEIAERTGVPEGTVRSRLSRGLDALGCALREPSRSES